jgi:predicted Zn-dependent protease
MRLRKAVRWEPGNPALRTRYASLLRDLSLTDPRSEAGWSRAAIESASKALLEEPVHADAHRLVGQLFIDRGEWEEGAAWLGRAVLFRPQDPYAHELLGDARRRLEDPEGAMEAYADAVRNAPVLEGSRYFNRIVGKAFLTSRSFEELAILGEENRPVLFAIAWRLLEEGEMGEARRASEMISERWPSDPKALETAARLALRAGDEKLGMATLERWESVAPKDPEVQIQMAVAKLEAGKREEAKARLTRAIALEPEAPLPYRLLAGILRGEGNREEALRVVSAGLRQAPDDPGLLHLSDKIRSEIIRYDIPRRHL